MAGDPSPLRRSALWWLLAAWAAVWLASRGMMISDLGYGRPGAVVQHQDLNVFQAWADSIARTGRLPTDEAWQYPPGAAFLFLLPRIAFNYKPMFMAMLVVADAAATMALGRMAIRSGRREGMWLWLLAVPVLGSISLIRFDMIPTALNIITFAVASSPVAFGAVAGVAAMVKVWPAALLVAPGEPRSQRRAFVAAAAAATGIALVAQIMFGNAMSFLANQSGRGLELEAIAATPWYVRQAVRGTPVTWAAGHGALEINTPLADTIANVLLAGLVVLAAACVAWMVVRYRLVRAGRADLAERSLGADAAFTAVLLFVVVYEVLSPQYVLWLIGLGAVAITSPGCRVRRPVVAVTVAVLLTRALLANWGDLVSGGINGAWLLVMRNIALVVAAVDAAITMIRVLRPSAPDAAAPAANATVLAD